MQHETCCIAADAGQANAVRRLLAGSALVVVACTAYTPESLEPAPSPLPSRLLPLHIGLGETGVLRPEGLRGVTLQTDFATVFRRDLETNAFLADDERWGYAEFRLTFDSDAVTGGGVAVAGLNVITLFVPSLLGAPVTLRERTLQAEIVIYNSRRVEVTKQVITAKARYSVGLYKRDEYRRAGIEAAKNVLQQFRLRLAPEVEAVNNRLRAVGVVP